jgi:hypothetical protein
MCKDWIPAFAGMTFDRHLDALMAVDGKIATNKVEYQGNTNYSDEEDRHHERAG